jgi:hypothetical protein
LGEAGEMLDFMVEVFFGWIPDFLMECFVSWIFKREPRKQERSKGIGLV